jgi:hypothetical protein
MNNEMSLLKRIAVRNSLGALARIAVKSIRGDDSLESLNLEACIERIKFSEGVFAAGRKIRDSLRRHLQGVGGFASLGGTQRTKKRIRPGRADGRCWTCFQTFALLLVFLALPASAVVLYVDLDSGNPSPPYATWATAATNIQDAVDAAAAGDQVLVTNGIYATGTRVVQVFGGALTERVAVTNALTVQSVNGPQFTIIDGGSVAGEVYLTMGATLSGFTLTNGAATGVPPYGGVAGVYCLATNAVVSNCVIVGNLAAGAFGGTLNHCMVSNNVLGRIPGAGASSCILNNCTISGNSGYSPGGGAYKCTLNNCVLIGNISYRWSFAPRSVGAGGGAYGCTLNFCTLSNNWADDQGGGAFNSTLNQCLLAGNSAGLTGGGAAFCSLGNSVLRANSAPAGGGSYNCALHDCMLINNSASSNAPPNTGGGAYGGSLIGCSIAGNTGGGTIYCSLTNSIIYYNQGYDYYYDPVYGWLDHCCTSIALTNGINNLTNAPRFVDLLAGDLHLQAGSPCINAGDNAAAKTMVDINENSSTLTNPTDLDGNPRIAGGTVDMGAYEFQGPPGWVATGAVATNWSCVACSADGSKLVAAVAGGWIYTSTNSGTTWEPRTSAGIDWRSVASSADGVRLAAVRGDSWVFISSDSGATWTQTSVQAYNNVVSSADGTNLAALKGPAVFAMVSTNAGTDWSLSSADGAKSAKPISLACSADGTTLLASGSASFNFGFLDISRSWGAFATNEAGYYTTWVETAPSNSLVAFYLALALSARGDIMFAGAWNGAIFRSSDVGTTWAATSAPINDWVSIAASADGTRLIAVAGGATTNGQVFTSNDSGTSWFTNDLPNTNWTSVASSADGHKLAAAASGGPIYTWQSTPTPVLNVRPSVGTNLVISWTVPSSSFTLQQNSDIRASSWTDVTNMPSLNYSTLQDQVTVPASSRTAFYRLMSK